MWWDHAEGRALTILINLQNSHILIHWLNIYSFNTLLLIYYVVHIQALGIQQWTGQTRSLPSRSSWSRGETDKKQARDMEAQVTGCKIRCWWHLSWDLKGVEVKAMWESGDANGGNSECKDPERQASLECWGTERRPVRLSVVMGEGRG